MCGKVSLTGNDGTTEDDVTHDTALELTLKRLTEAAQLTLMTLGRGNRPHSVSKTTRARLTRLELVTDVESLALTERGERVARILLGKLDVELRVSRERAREAAKTHVRPRSTMRWIGWSEGAIEHP